MALRDAFVNIAKNAAASAASGLVSGVASSLRSGLGGSSSSSASSPLQTNFAPKETLLLYPSDVGTNMHQASYILFARHSVSGAKVKPVKHAPKVKKIFRTFYDDDGGLDQKEDTAATRKAQQKSDEDFYATQDAETGRGGAGAGGSTTSLTLQSRNIQRTGTAIGLYMPPAVNVQYNMDYSEGEIGVMGEALYGLFKEYQNQIYIPRPVTGHL